MTDPSDCAAYHKGPPCGQPNFVNHGNPLIDPACAQFQPDGDYTCSRCGGDIRVTYSFVFHKAFVFHSDGSFKNTRMQEECIPDNGYVMEHDDPAQQKYHECTSECPKE